MCDKRTIEKKIDELLALGHDIISNMSPNELCQKLISSSNGQGDGAKADKSKKQMKITFAKIDKDTAMIKMNQEVKKISDEKSELLRLVSLVLIFNFSRQMVMVII